MSEAAEALNEFHAFFGDDAPERKLELRRTLIQEEFKELDYELKHGEVDLVRVYKELADLVYVAYGLDYHLGGYLDRVFKEVHRANMTKLWPCESCDGSGVVVAVYDDGVWDEFNCVDCKGTGKTVRKRADGKILKPPTYETADLRFLREASWRSS